MVHDFSLNLLAPAAAERNPKAIEKVPFFLNIADILIQNYQQLVQDILRHLHQFVVLIPSSLPEIDFLGDLL